MSNQETTAVIAGEYLKYVGSTVRLAITTAFWTGPAPQPGPAAIEVAPPVEPQPVAQGAGETAAPTSN